METIPTLLAIGCLSALSAAQIPCYEQSLGTDLRLGDDQVSQGNALGFTFPFAGGATSIDISSNGFVWLSSSNASGCCQGDPAALLAGLPRIAPLWTDLYPPSGGVYFNTFPNRAVVTWSQVTEYGSQTPFTVQLQLMSDGSFQFYYESSVAVSGHNALIGMSAGNGATDPGNTDFSAAMPFDTGMLPTAYELFAANTFDLGLAAVRFTPNGRGGYAVDRRTDCNIAGYRVYGQGCPLGPTVYELFQAGTLDLSGLSIDFAPNQAGGYDLTACSAGCLLPGYAAGTDLGLSDDSVARGVALGFSFPYAGTATTAVDVSSNGSVYLVPNSIQSHRCCNGDPAVFLGDPPSIAVLWQDLNPTAGGHVYAHAPAPGSLAITYDAVPEYGQSTQNTAQLVLFADGRFRLSFGQVSNQNHACLVGYTQGQGAADPGSTDLSVALPMSTGGGGTPLSLFPAAGSRPALGTVFDVLVAYPPLQGVAGLMVFGFLPLPGVSLGPVGMPGCRQWVSADALLPFALQGNFTQLHNAIPNDPNLIGVLLYQQAAVVAPGVNALGAVVSNAGEMTIGL
ncbi:MAG: hypothetical protein Fur0037_20380 [Planctomycetota bacterium]